MGVVNACRHALRFTLPAGIAQEGRNRRSAASRTRESLEQGFVKTSVFEEGRPGSALAGLGKRRNVVCLYPDSSPAPLQTSKAYLPSRAKQRLQGLYPLLRASSADLKRTVQALQLK